MKIDLSGRVALITGGASGIGRAIAETLLQANAVVAVCDKSREQVADLGKSNSKIFTAAGDVGNPENVDAIFSRVEKELGSVDVLVNNAGIAGPTARIEETPTDGWETTIRVNLSGPFYCARRAVPSMRRAGAGAIVNISSVAGRLGFPLRIAYSATKWGLIGMTETLAMELGPSGIRVNAVLPGLVEGERARKIVSAQAEQAGIPFDEAMKRFLSRVSMRTMIQPEEVAATVTFLVSDLGSHISGQSISVCGNFESYGSQH